MNKFKTDTINSPIRWAGSKKKILNEMLNEFAENKKNYIECFLGSGVVLLNVLDNADILKYKHFYVNDINCNIINFYLLLQNNVENMIINIKEIVIKYNKMSMEEKEKYYYKMRDKFNYVDKDAEKSILFYFLMKTGFNGVYRENKNGKFNVPFGKKEKIVFNDFYLREISKKIQNVRFYNMNYMDFLNKMKEENLIEDAFIYCDPPYLPEDKTINKKQELYTSSAFEHEEFFYFLSNIKTSTMISMSDSQNADIIYNHYPFYKKNMGDIIRTINPKKILSSKEIVYVNYRNEKSN